ncbi:MAG TPA: hypothetical protein PLD20_01860 [Blastocatellia bacterium]|nr:hypothetical protein [Blastocatellia bacterium]HMY75533.1 hypothetical protein [Blastocatellia bacterium]HMZ16682.1 hypothetical protein [Blastocatellia bacterium]HNG33867.1 hypothetical protein [Blastocatellia bacterium]
MKNVSLQINYCATRYDEQGRMLPPSTQTNADALLAVLRHAGAIGHLMQLLDENKIGSASGNTLCLMMENLGELLYLLTDAGMTIVNGDNEAASAFVSPARKKGRKNENG